MKTIFQIWLFLTIVSFIFYTPIHIFSNNAVDEVEEATFSDLIYSVGYDGMDYEKTLKNVSNKGVDISKELDDAFDDNLLIDDYEIDYSNSDDAKKIEATTGLKVIEAVIKTKNGAIIKLNFLVVDKAYYRSFAKLQALFSIVAEKNGYQYYFDEPEEAFLLVSYLFAEEEIISKSFIEMIEERLREMELKDKFNN